MILCPTADLKLVTTKSRMMSESNQDNTKEESHKKSVFLRIGINYYKRVEKPQAHGKSIEILLGWNYETIKRDREDLEEIEKYDGFCDIPIHIGYTQSNRRVGSFYNRYHPFQHKALKGIPVETLAFLNHVFGEQLDYGIDWFKVLLLYPTQMLPVLCLVSSKRNTGKTTFLNFLMAMFVGNMAIISNEEFNSNFNSHWSSMILLGIDEAFFSRKEDSEKIKSLSTAKHYKSEAKGQDRQDIEFFGKFVICSNNEDNFIQIDPAETRYWVRKLNSLKFDNTNLLLDLISEIPLFFHYLLETPFHTKHQSRMWFTSEQISTRALMNLKRANKNKLESEIAQVLLELCDHNESLTELSFCLGDVQQWLKIKGIYKGDSSSLKQVLQTQWNLSTQKNSNIYVQYRIGPNGDIFKKPQHKGRYYTISKKQILSINDIDDSDEKLITT